MSGTQTPFGQVRETELLEVPNASLSDVGLHLSGQFSQDRDLSQPQLDCISTIVMNIKLICSILITDEPPPSEVFEYFKPLVINQIQQMENTISDSEWRDIKLELLTELASKYKAKSHISDYSCFSNLNQFDQVIHQLYEERDRKKFGKSTQLSSSKTDILLKTQNAKVKKIENSIAALWAEMRIIVKQDNFTLERLECYDPYQDNTKKFDCTVLNPTTEGHFSLQLIDCNMEYGPEVFSWIQPPQHAVYVSQVLKAYDSVVPVKIKFLMPGNEDAPVIKSENYFISDIDPQKALLCYPKPFSKTLVNYRVDDICKLSTVDKQYQREIQLPIKWLFSPDTRLVITPEGRIFGINCRTTKQKTDRSMYQITEQKVSNRGQIPQPKRDSAIIHMEDCIYVIGGRGPNQPCSKKNFRYKIKEKKWKQIADSNFSLKKATVCTFQGRFIFKIGGINQFDYISKAIEMYDPTTNTWAVVRVNAKSSLQEVQILEDSLAVQINDDQIFVFGGKNTNRFPSDTGFVLNISEIRERKKRTAKVSGQFWNVSVGRRNIYSYFGLFSQSSVITYGNCLYSLRAKQCKLRKTFD